MKLIQSAVKVDELIPDFAPRSGSGGRSMAGPGRWEGILGFWRMAVTESAVKGGIGGGTSQTEETPMDRWVHHSCTTPKEQVDDDTEFCSFTYHNTIT